MYVGFDEFDEEQYARDTERAAQEVLEREKLLEEAFNDHFSKFFPRYLCSHGANIALNLIGRGRILEYLKEDAAPVMEELEMKRAEIAEEEKRLQEFRKHESPLQANLSVLYSSALHELCVKTEDEGLSADDLRQLINDTFDECFEKEEAMTEEYEALEYAEAEREMEEDYRQFLLEEQDQIYRSQQL